MLNFTSNCQSFIKTKPSGFRTPNLAIFFLTKYTVIIDCDIQVLLSHQLFICEPHLKGGGAIALLTLYAFISMPSLLEILHVFTVILALIMKKYLLIRSTM